jgi:predicted ATP-grasp superfamily ATP-dependent carboligase
LPGATGKQQPSVRATCVKVHEIPRFDPLGTTWKEVLLEVLRKERFDLVVPCNDPSVLPLQLDRKDPEPAARLYLVDDETFRITCDKHRMNEIAEDLHIPVLNGIKVTSDGDVDALASHLGQPLVLKPPSSFTKRQFGVTSRCKKGFNAGTASCPAA